MSWRSAVLLPKLTHAPDQSQPRPFPEYAFSNERCTAEQLGLLPTASFSAESHDVCVPLPPSFPAAASWVLSLRRSPPRSKLFYKSTTAVEACSAENERDRRKRKKKKRERLKVRSDVWLGSHLGGTLLSFGLLTTPRRGQMSPLGNPVILGRATQLPFRVGQSPRLGTPQRRRPALTQLGRTRSGGSSTETAPRAPCSAVDKNSGAARPPVAASYTPTCITACCNIANGVTLQ